LYDGQLKESSFILKIVELFASNLHDKKKKKKEKGRREEGEKATNEAGEA
jgi:hypothetical protein